MLPIDIPAKEFYNEQIGEFITIKPVTLQLEHSLISLSRWESKWKKPFLSKDAKTYEELIDYVRCMTMNAGHIDPDAYLGLSTSDIERIKDYISESQTATKVYDRRPNKGRGPKIMTSELIYYYMIANGIPFECQKWHLSRLLMLIQVCNVNGTPAQMNKMDIFKENSRINAARQAAMMNG